MQIITILGTINLKSNIIKSDESPKEHVQNHPTNAMCFRKTVMSQAGTDSFIAVLGYNRHIDK